MMGKKVLVVGACTGPGITMALRMLMPEVEFDHISVHEIWGDGGLERMRESIKRSDHWIYLKCDTLHDLSSEFEGIPFPQIAFNAFHPDEVMATSNGLPVMTVVQDINSAIGLWCYINGVPAKDAAALFNVVTFEELGYFDYWEPSVAALEKSFGEANMEFRRLFTRIKRKMPFMLTTLHPNMFFVAELSRQIALQIGYKGNPYNDPIENCMCELLAGIVSPLFPGVAERFGLRGAMRWRAGDKIFSDPESFLNACFALYPDRESIHCERLLDGAYNTTLGRHL